MDNPSVYLGPGYWASMHISSFKAKDYNTKCEVARHIARDISTFPCLKCRRHGTEYSRLHPFIKAISDPDELSLFRWVWEFHNTVNERIGKEIVSFEEAVMRWGNQEQCKENCKD